MERYCLLTNDVELLSIKTNYCSEKIGKHILNEGMPLLLDLYHKYGVKSTFFFTGDLAEKFPELVRMILGEGHEVGCHGYSHEITAAFDLLPFQLQKQMLDKAKRILEDISGQEVISFRAPALRVNGDTVRALIETGFKLDSSVASQRFDFFLSFGSKEKMKRIFAPRLPYRTSIYSLYSKGKDGVIEIPISAFLYPYIGTTLRVFPNLTRFTRILLNLENKFNGKPINFLTHPTEFINEEENFKINRRAKGFFDYLLKDLIRNRLKLKNLGPSAISLYEKEILYFKKRGYKFLTIKSYVEKNGLFEKFGS